MSWVPHRRSDRGSSQVTAAVWAISDYWTFCCEGRDEWPLLDGPTVFLLASKVGLGLHSKEHAHVQELDPEFVAWAGMDRGRRRQAGLHYA
jgi:hypothetical protein